MTNVLEKEFYHFERNVGEGISIHYMDAYLKFFFFAFLRAPPPPPRPQLEILGPSLPKSECCPKISLFHFSRTPW